MPLFKTPFPSKFKKPPLNSLPCSTPSSSSHHHLLTKNNEHHLLSLLHLHRHRPETGPAHQIHAYLITSSLHRTQISQTGIIIWNTLIKIYSRSPSPQHSLLLYNQMLHFCAPQICVDTFTFSFLLKACANLSSARIGAQLHCLVVKNGFAFHLYVHTSLVNMYATRGYLIDAKKAFDEMPERSLVTWNAMITGFALSGEIEKARQLFERMPTPDVVSWTGMIDGYTRANQAKEALDMFRRMSKRAIMPTEITVLAIVPSISNLGSVELGETLHARCHKGGLTLVDVRVENSLIDMYAKCGSIENSKKLFDTTSNRKNLVSWTTIITAFATHGMVKQALQLFEDMKNEKNIRPNRVTFLSVLNACSHGGLVEEGLQYFSSMVFEYDIEPDIKHYGCLIDMLGRAGRLEEAEETIRGMPVAVNVVVWRTLLVLYKFGPEVELGKE
ncbi:uncharacterized protein A4U43_C02F15270 [Asparagus officinalis]|uniref:Pentacotripeptide-repeat region of PRORP domain-containing protein n=2 Tax=Asparagus officinalis TaxID=4686 RepID=A0A5P1FKC8_ASPOF|nr:uncharacterized protein A4U43_C02F15270 [Asparagus officinalis]